MGFGTGVKIGVGITCGGCLTFVLIIAGLAYMGQRGAEAARNSTQSSTSISKPTPPAPSPASTPAVTTTPSISVWHYSEEQDQMGRGSIKRAWIESSNVINFGFPYAGDQRGTLTIRKHPSYGKDVILEIDKGQFLVGIDGCTVNVRFDDGKARPFSAVGPADHGTTSLFISNYTSFVSAAKKAKKIQMEAPFFQEGMRVFEFDSQGLNWE